MSRGASLTSWGEDACLVMVDHPSSDGVAIKIYYGVDIYYINQPRTPSFSIGLVKLSLTLLLDQLRWAYGDEHWW